MRTAATTNRPDTAMGQQCWIRPRISPPPLPHCPYGLHPPSPPPSSLSEDTPLTPPLSSVRSPILQPTETPVLPSQQPGSPVAPRPKSWSRQQLTQTQVLEMDEDGVQMEQDHAEIRSWCSLDLCLSDPISIPSDSQENLDIPLSIPEVVFSKSASAARDNKTTSCPSPRRSQSDSAASKPAAPSKPTSSGSDPGPTTAAGDRPPPTPVIITPPSSPVDTSPPLSRLPSLALSQCAPSESQPSSAPASAEQASQPSTALKKPKKRRGSQKCGSTSAPKRARASIKSGLLFESITFLLTGFSGSALVKERAELIDTIKSLGGHVSESDTISDSVNLHDENDALIRIVIVKDIRKDTWTTKLFYTLLRGVPAVDMSWIEECNRQNRIVALQPFAGPFRDIIRRSNAHYPKERRLRPLFGRRIAYFGPNKEEFISIIHSSGGIALRQQSKADLIIIGDKDLQSTVVRNRIIQATQAEIPVVSLQWLKEAATTQSFPDIERSIHRLDIDI